MRKNHPMQEIVKDKHGVIRFRKNEIIDYVFRKRDYIDLNDVCLKNTFSKADRMQLAQLLGYSVSGFGDLSYSDPLVVRAADKKANKLWKETNK